MKKDVMICGVGGQGTVLASKIIAASAMEEGSPVHSAETIGMSQRGGSVTSHVRIGEDSYSPLIPFGSADVLLAFEPSEAVRNLRYLKPDGVAVVNTAATKPVTASLNDTGYDGSEMVAYLEKKCSCIFVNSDEVCRPFGSSKFFNIIMLGIAAGSGKLGIGQQTILAQIEKRVPQKFVAVNKEAFQTGFAIGSSGQN
ncbi:MAG: indolepyruvate oxidoreductase subunit beta [Lachnospiraceae bacterium]|nr:indolepyruvate oxidoreductase subunit beta [Lachnospiraceae bacterium]MBQ9614281.1 indolepyruvate oxidoreductase subunit beta [Lachnospiraceae bacterium]